jgi:hypothetical protein
MRLVLVHGINQQAKSAVTIEREWLDTLRMATVRSAEWPKPPLNEIVTPFYGDRLFALAKTKQNLNAIAQGTVELEDDFETFAWPVLVDMALSMGASDADIECDESTSQGAGVHKRSICQPAR